MNSFVFLGGACGQTTWRTDIAIPILEQAGVDYYNPQLAAGEWTPAHQYAEMEAKNKSAVWLFVITGDTRGIASIGEVAYRIGQKGKIALAITDVLAGTVIDGKEIPQNEADDINRGRVFLRAMAEENGVPVFSSIADAAHHAVDLFKQSGEELSLEKLEAIIQRIQLKGFHFHCEKIADKFAVLVRQETEDTLTGELEEMSGRRWLIEPEAGEAEVVRTLLKAALTWDEHELREQFRFDGKQIFNPHFKL